ncbi:MAG: cytochrome c [Methylohalobius sp.]|nr:cytochrome c [Methylohalobius sp.]
MKYWTLIALLTVSNSLLAADPEAGKAKTAVCAGCHGQDGIATNPAYPNLAGQNAQYLVAAMKAYKDGSRNNPIMKPMVEALSEADLENIAAYYASLKK